MTTPNSAKFYLFYTIQRALKANLVPGLFLQTFALFIGLSYFFWPASHLVFDFFAELKVRYGAGYAILSTAVFGGLIPFVYLFVCGKIKQMPFAQCCFYLVIWALMGGLVNEFYQLQSYLFGDQPNWQTIVKKTAFDQVVFSAMLTCPFLTLVYLWKDQGFSWQQTRPLLGQLLRIQIPTTILTNWLIWIPAVSVIYLMPPNLQIPLFNLVLCFFVLIFAILHQED